MTLELERPRRSLRWPTPSHSPLRHPRLWAIRSLTVGAITLSAAIFAFAGLTKSLPYAPEVDEAFFAEPAIHIAATGDLNPRWFGHPGSTVIYPLALFIHLQNALIHHGSLWHADSRIRQEYPTYGLNYYNDSEFIGDEDGYYRLGRVLSSVYFLLSIPLVWLIGRRMFGERVGLIAAWLSVPIPLTMRYVQVTRSDAAALFFGLLSFLLCLRLVERPTLGRQIGAGIVIGLAIATRYFMISLIPVFILANGIPWLQRRGEPRHSARLLRTSAAGLAAIFAAFALSTPYLFLDFRAAWPSVLAENEPRHPGADGLSRWGNVHWFVTKALPQSVTTPIAVLALVGFIFLVLAPARRRTALNSAFPLIYIWTVFFLASISALHTHFDRWLIEILPIVLMFAAWTIDAVSLWLTRRITRDWQLRGRNALLLAIVASLSLAPVAHVVAFDKQQRYPSTRIVARQWMIDHLPSGSRIFEEAYCAPLAGTNFSTAEQFFLALARNPSDYAWKGYAYVVASSQIYARFFMEPKRYVGEVSFYRQLFAEMELMQEFVNAGDHQGPTIRIYRVRVTYT